MLTYDIVIVGDGLAALRAALECYEHTKDIALISRTHPLRSADTALTDGFAAPLNNANDGDSPEAFAADLVAAGDGFADRDLVAAFSAEAREEVIRLEHLGCPFSRQEDGRIAQRPAPGHGSRRLAHSRDGIGLHAVHTLWGQLQRHGIRLYADCLLASLATSDGVLEGLVAYDMLHGELKSFRAKSVIIASSSLGGVYRDTVVPSLDGLRGLYACLQGGLPLRNLEFVEFTPLGFPMKPFATPGFVRSQKVALQTPTGEEVVSGDHAATLPDWDVALRVEGAIAAAREQDEKALPFVLADLTGLAPEYVAAELPHYARTLEQVLKVPFASAKAPCAPSQTGIRGGVACDAAGTTDLPGLFVAGATADQSPFGAASLSGVTATHALVSGRRAGSAAGAFLGTPERRNERKNIVKKTLRTVTKTSEEKFAGNGTEDPAVLSQKLRELMSTTFGVERDGEAMAKGADALAKLQERFTRLRPAVQVRRLNFDRARVFDLEAAMLLAEVIARSAQARTESRGVHRRSDGASPGDPEHVVSRLEYGDLTISRSPALKTTSSSS